MDPGHFLQLGQPGHGAVFIHDFHQHPPWFKSGHPGQVGGRLGMTGTAQYTTFFRDQGEDMSGPGELFRPGFGVDQGQYGLGTVLGRDAGSAVISQ